MLESCPHCKGPLHLSVDYAEGIDGLVVRPQVKAAQLKQEDMIAGILPMYWRWIAEGKPRHNQEQSYYDDYHNHISFKEMKDNKAIYEYRIQTFDSPDGDTWVNGEFSFDNYFGVVVRKTELERC